MSKTFAELSGYQRLLVLQKRDEIRRAATNCWGTEPVRWERMYAASAILGYYIAGWHFQEFRRATLINMRAHL